MELSPTIINASIHNGQLFVYIFLAMLLIYYLLPASLAYYFLFVWNKEKYKSLKIQVKYPSKDSIYREIRSSIGAIFIFSILILILVRLIQNGYTLMYFNIREYGIAFIFISPVLALIVHDTYYYWLHRFMHWKPVFPYIHSLHHRSYNPTPFAIYSFQPIESILTFSSIILTVFIIPMHPVSVGIYLFICLINNVGGHTGHEFLPRWMVHHPVLKYANVVTFHDMHHTNINYNYGNYFNIWDRIMGTIHKDFLTKFESVKNQKR